MVTASDEMLGFVTNSGRLGGDGGPTSGLYEKIYWEKNQTSGCARRDITQQIINIRIVSCFENKNISCRNSLKCSKNHFIFSQALRHSPSQCQCFCIHVLRHNERDLNFFIFLPILQSFFHTIFYDLPADDLFHCKFFLYFPLIFCSFPGWLPIIVHL